MQQQFLRSYILMLAVLFCGTTVHADPPHVELERRALDYMSAHPPTVGGNSSQSLADNQRLAERNSELYERMPREDLAMNYFALLCTLRVVKSPAQCDGEAVLLLGWMQHQRNAVLAY